MNDILFYAFQDELEKIAVSAGWIRDRVGHASQIPGQMGKGGLGGRKSAIEKMREQGGYGNVMANTASEKTRNQIGRVLDLVREKRERMLQKPPRFTGNPKSLARAQQFAKEIDTLSEVADYALHPKRARRAFPTKLKR